MTEKMKLVPSVNVLSDDAGLVSQGFFLFFVVSSGVSPGCVLSLSTGTTAKVPEVIRITYGVDAFY